jgi:hypothetical protein
MGRARAARISIGYGEPMRPIDRESWANSACAVSGGNPTGDAPSFQSVVELVSA